MRLGVIQRLSFIERSGSTSRRSGIRCVVAGAWGLPDAPVVWSAVAVVGPSRAPPAHHRRRDAAGHRAGEKSFIDYSGLWPTVVDPEH